MSLSPLKKMIDSYEFGVIVIDKKQYSSDVIIYPERVDDHWWRKKGHLLLPQDLEEVTKEKPTLLVIGTGNSGLMKVPLTTLEWIQSKGIEVRIELTQKACQIYNQLHKSKKIIAALHLTC